MCSSLLSLFTDPATTEIYTLSLHDALPILFPADGITKGELASYYESIAPVMLPHLIRRPITMERFHRGIEAPGFLDRKSTRLNSSHSQISYAVFCLKKKKKKIKTKYNTSNK